MDAFGHKAILSGTSRYLSDLIHDNLNCKSRAIEFSTMQRCASHLASRTDVNEAYAVGGAAASAAFAGETGRMISLKRISDYPYQCITESVDVQQVANLEAQYTQEKAELEGMKQEYEAESQNLQAQLDEKRATSADYDNEIAYAQQQATDYANLLAEQTAELQRLEAERIAAEEEARRQAEAEAAARAQAEAEEEARRQAEQ